MKKLIIAITAIIILVLGLIFFNSISNQSVEQSVLEKTYNISKEYVALRYRTDNVLINAKGFGTYEVWNKEMTDIINRWEILEKNALVLEKEAEEMSTEDKFSLNIINTAIAYNKQEISDIFDKAPAGKKIITLAKHLGVDAKRAYKILTQDQAQVEADAWNEAGDTFQKLETSATVIKDGCKVAGFVGTIALTGGTSALAAGSTLAKVAVVVSGADLTLEVSDDAAKIALGNHNKVSAIVGSVRTVTEPLSTILNINEIPKNLKTGFEKFSSTMVALEQFNSAAQDGKIIGIELPSYKKEKNPVKVSVLEKIEIEKWLRDNGIDNKDDTKEEVEAVLGVSTIRISEETSPEEEVVVDIDKKGGSNLLSIISPEGNNFTPEAGLSFAAELRNPESFIVEGKKSLPVWCHWKFYFENNLYSEKINPSTVHAGTKNVCEYSTLLIKEQKGKLRVEFNLERGTQSKYSEETEIHTLIKTERSYTVQ